MKTIIRNVLFLVLLVGVVSCTDDNDEGRGGTIVKPGVYTADMSLQTERGDKNEMVSRGVDETVGTFTDEYPLDHIYLHSADVYVDEKHKSLRIPLKNEGAKTANVKKVIHLELEVLENGDYVIGYGGQEKIILSSGEKVYFSTLETPYWEANVVGATPETKKDVFLEGENNIELLRSATSYSCEEFKELMKKPSIELARCTTGFKVYFMFTESSVPEETDSDQKYIISAEKWKEQLGYTPENFYIKLYFGPNFAHKYDILNDEPVQVEGKKEGYYVTNRQLYKPFGNSRYYTTGSKLITYGGFGYQSDHILLSPLDKDIKAEEFSLYAFIKFNKEANSSDSDFLGEDNGAKYFRAQIEGMTMELNRIHYVVFVYHYKDLKKAFLEENQSIKTRSPWSGPEKIELTPAKVIVR